MKTKEELLEEISALLDDVYGADKENAMLVPEDVQITSCGGYLGLGNGIRILRGSSKYGWLVVSNLGEEKIDCRFEPATFGELKAGDIFYYGPDDTKNHTNREWYYVAVGGNDAAWWVDRGGVGVSAFSSTDEVLKVVPV